MITIDVKLALICLVLIAVFVLLIFLIVLVKNAITTIKNVNKITEDAAVITAIAKEKTVDINDLLSDFKSAGQDLVEAIKGKKNLLGAIANLAKAGASVVAYVKSKTSDEEF